MRARGGDSDFGRRIPSSGPLLIILRRCGSGDRSRVGAFRHLRHPPPRFVWRESVTINRMSALAPSTAAENSALMTTDISLVILVIAGTLIGVILGWVLRGRSSMAAQVPGHPGTGNGPREWPLEEIGDRHLGFILARSGESPRVSRGIVDLLSGVGLKPEDRKLDDASDQWLAAVDVDDRIELRSMLGLDGDDPDRVLQIRVRIPDANIDAEGARPSSLRWFEVRRTSECDGQIELALVDQTQQVLDEQRRMIQLRNQRLLTLAAQRISLSEDFAEAIAEAMLIFGEGLNLRASGWYMERAGTDGLAWDMQAGWSSDIEGSVPECLEEIGLSIQEEEARESLLVGTPERPGLLLVPLVAEQKVMVLLGLEAHGGDLWGTETLEIIRQLAGLLGRRFEQESVDSEREAWAATRGAFERSEAIAQLTGGVAHDFNGVIFAVLGRFELLRDRITDPEGIQELDEISKILQEAKRLGDRLRKSLRPSGDPLPLDVRADLEEICHGIEKLLPKRLDFNFNIALPPLARPMELYAGSNDLQRILFNLIVNARDAVGMHGRIQLGARMLENQMIEIRVDDDGPGIDEADRERMLEPYETGDESDGVGLGLAVCQRTAEELGGSLVLDDSPLGGLAVRVVLPVRVEMDDQNSSESSDASSAGMNGIGRVLVIEDNPVIRDVLVRVLDGMGAQVLSQGHALDVEKILSDEGDVDILIFDIDLPERTGIQCLHDLRESGVETPCLLISGGNSVPPTSISGTDFLRKPFRIEDLRQAVIGLLGRNSGT